MVMNRSKSLAGVILAFAVVVGLSAPAAAHDPIFVEEAQTTPDTGPYMPDGTISWALYGSVLEAGDTRGFEFDLRDGDELYVALLIPNLEPELSLGDGELPTLALAAPDGSIIDIAPEIREVFDEPFSQTSYVTLAEIRQPGQGGRYQGIVTGNAAARFTVAIGEREIFFTDSERSGDRPSTFQEISGPLQVWYATPPGEDPPAEADETGGDGEVQMDLIDEAMESGEATDSREAEEEGAAIAENDSTDDESTDDESTDADGTDEAESAAVADDGAEESSLGFVAPLVLVAVLAAGLVLFFVRRNDEADAA